MAQRSPQQVHTPRLLTALALASDISQALDAAGSTPIEIPCQEHFPSDDTLPLLYHRPGATINPSWEAAAMSCWSPLAKTVSAPAIACAAAR